MVDALNGWRCSENRLRVRRGTVDRPRHLHTEQQSTHKRRRTHHTMLPSSKLLQPMTPRTCFDNAPLEAFFSVVGHEALSRHHFTTKAHTRRTILLRLTQTPRQLSRIVAAIENEGCTVVIRRPPKVGLTFQGQRRYRHGWRRAMAGFSG